jgi:hypothetical protein
MTPEQIEITKNIYQKFYEIDCNQHDWTSIDEYMSHLDYLDDKQVAIEAEVKLREHLSGNPKCKEHEEEHECLVPKIIEAVKIIINGNREKKKIHIKDRFVLQYYLALSQAKYIVS